MALVVKNPPANEGYLRDRGLEDPPGGGYGNALQEFCLENPMGRGVWGPTVHRIAHSRAN